MYRRLFLFSCFLLFFLSSVNLSFSDALSPNFKKSTHHSIEEILSFHVEHKQFSSLLVKRTIKVFFEQFDPNRIYLLHSEIEPFVEMEESQLQMIAIDHQMSEYPLYEKIDTCIQASILRSRKCRQILEKEFIETGILTSGKPSNGNFSKTEGGLKDHLRHFLSSVIEIEKKMEGLIDATSEERKKIVDLLEKKIQKNESAYLAFDNGRALSMHIVKAFAKSLDAHTCFFTPEEANDLRMNLEKQFEGIGIVFREGIKGISVKSLVQTGPAEKSSQIQVGDILIAVNGKPCEGCSYQEVMEWLRVAKGSKINLVFLNKENKSISVDLVKEKIVLEEERLRYTVYPYGDGIIGVIQLPSFYENGDGMSAEKDMKQALRELKKQGKLLGLVVDVRNNTGGFLSQAVKVAGLFMTSGVVVISKYAHNQMQYLRDVNGQMFYQGPLVILTSKLSASATEIVAQALQDYGIALVVGDHRTYGKGSIQYQTVTEEKASSYFKVTIGKYYTVSGRSTQIEGVKADVVVPTKYTPFNIGEKYLPYALKNDQVPSAFLDLCTDVDERNLSWFQKNYLPNLQKKLSCWTAMLPVLKKNSEYRLSHDKDFLAFLQILQSKPSMLELQEGGSLYLSSIDLQLNEALNVVKDMTLLQKQQKKTQP